MFWSVNSRSSILRIIYHYFPNLNHKELFLRGLCSFVLFNCQLQCGGWCGDLVTVGGAGLVEGEGEVRWKESHRQEWAGLDWTD